MAAIEINKKILCVVWLFFASCVHITVMQFGIPRMYLFWCAKKLITKNVRDSRTFVDIKNRTFFVAIHVIVLFYIFRCDPIWWNGISSLLHSLSSSVTMCAFVCWFNIALIWSHKRFLCNNPSWCNTILYLFASSFLQSFCFGCKLQLQWFSSIFWIKV